MAALVTFPIFVPASGNEITGAKTYTLGQPMYFEAKQPGNSASDKRIYINKCFMTASQDPDSSPKYTVIENQGYTISTLLQSVSTSDVNMHVLFAVV